MEGSADIFSYKGHQILDCAGETLGRVEEIYLDAATNRPHWARVELAALGDKQTLVPLAGALPAGENLQLAYEKETVIHAPANSAGELHRYYGLIPGAEPLGPPPDWP